MIIAFIFVLCITGNCGESRRQEALKDIKAIKDAFRQ
jgi:hypothetical protein